MRVRRVTTAGTFPEGPFCRNWLQGLTKSLCQGRYLYLPQKSAGWGGGGGAWFLLLVAWQLKTGDVASGSHPVVWRTLGGLNCPQWLPGTSAVENAPHGSGVLDRAADLNDSEPCTVAPPCGVRNKRGFVAFAHLLLSRTSYASSNFSKCLSVLCLCVFSMCMCLCVCACMHVYSVGTKTVKGGWCDVMTCVRWQKHPPFVLTHLWSDCYCRTIKSSKKL